MEYLWLRIPHIFEKINELLDDKSLIKCKEVSRIICSIIKNQKSGKFLTTRMIQCYIKNPGEFSKDWRIIFQTLPAERLSEFEILVKNFYKAFPSRFENNWSPMHISAERGHLDFCKFIAKVSFTKIYKLSPLLFSVQAGHLEVSKFIYKEVEGNNHRRNQFQLTAQYLAAKNGHMEIYKFLHEKSNDINPFMQELITPLHLAAQYGHFQACKYICDNTVLVGPRRSDGMTPFLLATHRGHFKVARLLIERDPPILPTGFLEKVQLMLMILLSILSIFIWMEFTSNTFLLILAFNECKSKATCENNEGLLLTCKFLLNLQFITLFFGILLTDAWFSFWTSPKLKLNY
jgi:ankyrin repeat protein